MDGNNYSGELSKYIKGQEMFKLQLKNIDILLDMITEQSKTVANDNIKGFQYTVANILKQQVNFVSSTIPNIPSYYIPRMISSQRKLNSQTFTRTCSDIFVFKNINYEALSEFLGSDKAIFMSKQILQFYQNTKLTTRLIFLEDEEDWQEMKNLFAMNNIHLVSVRYPNLHGLMKQKEEKHEYILEDSTGGFLLFNDDCHEESVFISEDELVRKMDEKTTSGICICDTPGMGKSLLLANLARKISLKSHAGICAFISFPKILESLNWQLPSVSNLTFKFAINLMLDSICSSSLATDILQKAIKDKYVCLHLLVDGFDEIPTEDKAWAEAMLLVLFGQIESVKVHVTSRPHLRQDLEQIFNTKAYGIMPFTKEQQHSFLLNHWRLNISNFQETALTEFANQCLEQLRSSNNLENIIGVPLQCYLIAELYIKKATLLNQNIHDHESDLLLKSPTEANVTEIKNEIDDSKESIRQVTKMQRSHKFLSIPMALGACLLLFIMTVIALLAIVHFPSNNVPAASQANRTETAIDHSENILGKTKRRNEKAVLLTNVYYKIRATSYTKYQTEIYNVPFGYPVEVTVQINLGDTWPRNAPLEKSNQIISLHLNGQFDLELVLFFLENTPNIRNVTITNELHGICHQSKVTNEYSVSNNFVKSITLSNLQSITFLNFTTCNHVYKIFSEFLKYKKLGTLQIENSVVNNENKAEIHSILKNSRMSLRKLYFPMTSWDDLLFDDDLVVFPNVQKIRFDFITNTNSTVFVQTQINKCFPALNSFVSLNGFCPWNDFRAILRSKSLTVLRLGMEFPIEKSAFTRYFRVYSFPLLTEAQISIRFQTISHVSPCPMGDVREVKNVLKNCSLEFHCQIVDQIPPWALTRTNYVRLKQYF